MSDWANIEGEKTGIKTRGIMESDIFVMLVTFCNLILSDLLVVPLAIGSDHLLGLIDPTLALRAAVLVVLLRLDHPRLDGAPGQHVILVVVELAQVLCPWSKGLPSVP